MPELLGKSHNNPPSKGASLVPWWDSDRKCGGGGGFPARTGVCEGKRQGLPNPPAPENPGGAQQAVQRRHTVSTAGVGPSHLMRGAQQTSLLGATAGRFLGSRGCPAGRLSREAPTLARSDSLRTFHCFLFNLCTDRFIFAREKETEKPISFQGLIGGGDQPLERQLLHSKEKDAWKRSAELTKAPQGQHRQGEPHPGPRPSKI